MALELIRNSYRGEHMTIRFAECFEILDHGRVDLSVPSTLHCPHQKRFHGNLTDTLVDLIATLL